MHKSVLIILAALSLSACASITNDSHQPVALSFSDGGKGLIIGLCVAFIGLAADQILRTWAENKKTSLGIA